MRHLDRQVMVSCEHATNRLPDGMHLPDEVRGRHIAWDPGALPIAERLAHEFEAPLFAGEVSRLVIDLNRTVGNRMLIRRVSDGHRIGFNYGLGEAARQDRVRRYYRPYRDAVAAAARRIIDRQGRCLHVSVHTFTEVMGGKRRRNDIGLLHDPSWGIERPVSADLRAWLEARTDYVVWYNRPYSGTADGILPQMRRLHDPRTYVGIEIEVNQKHAGAPAELRRIATALAAAFRASDALRQSR